MGRTGALWGAFEASKPRCLFAHVSGVHQVRRELAATSFVRKDYRRLGETPGLKFDSRGALRRFDVSGAKLSGPNTTRHYKRCFWGTMTAWPPGDGVGAAGACSGWSSRRIYGTATVFPLPGPVSAMTRAGLIAERTGAVGPPESGYDSVCRDGFITHCIVECFIRAIWKLLCS